MADQSLKEVKTEKVNCPTCKGRNTLQRYADGHGICGQCKFYEPPTVKDGPQEDRGPGNLPLSKDKRLVQPDSRSWERLDARKINPDTLRKFGYFAGQTSAWGRVQIAPLHDFEGTTVAQLVIKRDGGTELLRYGGPAVPMDKMWLFGRATFGERYDRKVVVCQRPQDALAVAQVKNFKLSVVSLNGGLDEAARDLKANYRWLERFQEIVLFWDTTPEALRKAQECATIFPAGRVKIARLDAHTSPGEALSDNRAGDIDTAIWSAATYRPKGILNAKDGLDDFVATAGLLPQWPYPFEHLQARTLGMRPGEVSYHVGGTGASKTTILYQYVAHLVTLPQQPPVLPEDVPQQLPRPKVGWLGFEDTVRSVKIGLLSAHAKHRMALLPLDKKKVARLHEELFGGGDVELYDPETAEYNWEAIRGYVLYLAKALDCKVVVVDPLTFIIGIMAMQNERQAIDKISGEFAALAKQNGIHIHVSYHLNRPDGTPHEEGAKITLNHIKGSGGIAHFSSNVFGYERDQQGERSDLMRVRALKVRLTGYTGANHGEYRDHQILKYDPNAGTYEETDDEWPSDEETGSSGKRPQRKEDY